MSKRSREFQEYCLLKIMTALERQGRKLGAIMTTVNELAGKLNEQAAIMQKVFGEVAALKEALRNLENLPADAETALANLSSIIKSVDDQNPDAEPAQNQQNPHQNQNQRLIRKPAYLLSQQQKTPIKQPCNKGIGTEGAKAPFFTTINRSTHD